MKAKVSIYTDLKQTVTTDEHGVRFESAAARKKYSGKVQKETAVGEKTLYSTEYEVKGNLPLRKKLARIEHFATQVIGARIAALISSGKRFPSKVFFKIELNGQVFTSKTALAKAELTQVIAVNMRQLIDKASGNVMGDKQVMDLVSGQQKKGIRSAINFLQNVERAAKEADKINDEQEGFSFMAVTTEGQIVDTEAEVTTSIEPVQN